MTDRLRLLQERKDSQASKLSEASNQLAQIDQTQQNLQFKLKRTLEFQSNLTARASTVLQVVNTCQHKYAQNDTILESIYFNSIMSIRLSKAEADYLSELKEMHRAEDFYSDKIEELKKRASKAKDGNKPLPQIAPAQLDKIKPIIEDEYVLMLNNIYFCCKCRCS